MEELVIKATMVVEFCVEVPDGTDVDQLCLALNTDLVEVEDVNMGQVKGSKVSSYSTVNVWVDEEG